MKGKLITAALAIVYTHTGMWWEMTSLSLIGVGFLLIFVHLVFRDISRNLEGEEENHERNTQPGT